MLFPPLSRQEGDDGVGAAEEVGAVAPDAGGCVRFGDGVRVSKSW